MPKRTIINTKVDNTKPNVIKMRAYNKSMTIAKIALPHFKPFHNSMKRFASPFPKMLFKIRMTERAPSPTLDQKKIKPDPGEENVPSPKSIAMTATKIETANQNEPLMTCFRSIVLPILSIERLSFAVQNNRETTKRSIKALGSSAFLFELQLISRKDQLIFFGQGALSWRSILFMPPVQ